jgi:hypothetical protein
MLSFKHCGLTGATQSDVTAEIVLSYSYSFLFILSLSPRPFLTKEKE